MVLPQTAMTLYVRLWMEWKSVLQNATIRHVKQCKQSSYWIILLELGKQIFNFKLLVSDGTCHRDVVRVAIKIFQQKTF